MDGNNKATLRELTLAIPQLREVVGWLDVRSAPGREALYDLPWMTDPDMIERSLESTQRWLDLLSDRATSAQVETVRVRLAQLRDIEGTASGLAEGRTADEIELFELKSFAMTAESICEVLSDLGINDHGIPALGAINTILDPDNTGVPHFYIYGSYSEQLTQVREQIRTARNSGEGGSRLGELLDRQQQLESIILAELSALLRPHAAAVLAAIEVLSRLDITIAGAALAAELGLTRPRIAVESTQYTGLFNPCVKAESAKRGAQFQPIDISLGDGPIVITGANMGGKTVLLSSLALAQAMFQLGFFVPATQAHIGIVENISLILAEQQTQAGLSSFAGEMVRLKQMMADVKEGVKTLALVDEPARTTNPAEGAAIAGALVDFLARHRVSSVITTHYGGVGSGVRRMRVKGFRYCDGPVSLDRIQEQMDYSLEEYRGEDTPREALRIAEMIGMDAEFIGTAREFIDKNS